MELTTASPKTLLEIQTRWGVLFQQNALFTSLTLLENVSFPLWEHTQLDSETIKQLATLKILMPELPRLIFLKKEMVPARDKRTKPPWKPVELLRQKRFQKVGRRKISVNSCKNY